MSAVSQVLKTIAYSSTDMEDRLKWAIIPIPEGCKYVSHTVRHTTELGNFSVSHPIFVRHTTLTDQVVEVRVAAIAKDRFLARSWIGIELAVTVEPR